MLADKGLGRCVTIVAEYLPGDTAPSYTSPWAGCNYSSVSGSDANALRWDRLGYAYLIGLATEVSDAAFVRRTPSVEVWDDVVPQYKIKVMSEYLEDVRFPSPHLRFFSSDVPLSRCLSLPLVPFSAD